MWPWHVLQYTVVGSVSYLCWPWYNIHVVGQMIDFQGLLLKIIFVAPKCEFNFKSSETILAIKSATALSLHVQMCYTCSSIWTWEGDL